MPRPTTKQDLLAAAEQEYNRLWALINSMSQVEQGAAFDFGVGAHKKEAHWKRDKNVRDILVHLYEWHQLLLRWVRSNRIGEQSPFLPEPYNWKTYGDMNVQFWTEHQSTPYETAVTMLHESHTEVIDLVHGLSDEELFSKGYFPWTGGSTLGQYCVSTTSSHYDWATKKIKAHVNMLNTPGSG